MLLDLLLPTVSCEVKPKVCVWLCTPQLHHNPWIFVNYGAFFQKNQTTKQTAKPWQVSRQCFHTTWRNVADLTCFGTGWDLGLITLALYIKNKKTHIHQIFLPVMI